MDYFQKLRMQKELQSLSIERDKKDPDSFVFLKGGRVLRRSSDWGELRDAMGAEIKRIRGIS